MGNYKQDQISGHQRSCAVKISNPFQGVPTIMFDEEVVVAIDGKPTITQPVGYIPDSMSDPAKMFDLIHPETDEVVGSASYQDIYVMLYSLYRALAAERDEALELENV